MSVRGLTDGQYVDTMRRMRSFGMNPCVCPICGADPDNDMDCTSNRNHDCTSERSRLRDQIAAGLTPLHLRFDPTSAQPTSVTRAVEAYLTDFEAHVGAGHGLVFLAANYGSGKTSALAQIVRHALDHGYGPRDARLIGFQDIISAYRREDTQDFLLELQSVQLLAVDEIGVPISEAQATLFEQFAAIVDAHYVAMHPIFLAGNINVADMERHYPKVFSRLHSMVDFIEVPEIDFRRRHRIHEIPA